MAWIVVVSFVIVSSFLGLGCGSSEPGFFWLASEVSVPNHWVLDYGQKWGKPGENPHPVVAVRGTSVCLQSRSEEVRDRGIRLQLCFPDSPKSREGLRSLLPPLLNQSSVDSYPRFFLNHEWGRVQFDYLTETSFRNEWKRNRPEVFLLGDIRLQNSLGETHSIGNGVEKFSIIRDYAVPYWNYARFANGCFVYFTLWDLDQPGNSRRMLRINLPCDPFHGKILSFLQKIYENHRKWETECESGELSLVEYFAHTNSRYTRYAEMENRNPFILCSDYKLRRKNGALVPLMLGESVPFILPGSLVLLGDSSSRLPVTRDLTVHKENTPEAQFLVGLTSQQVAEEFQSLGQNFPLPASFRMDDEYFAYRMFSNSCRREKNPWVSKEKLCGSPGYANTEILKANDSQMNCRLGELWLSEINYFGVPLESGNTDSRGRYLEWVWLPGTDRQTADSAIHIADGLQCNLADFYYRLDGALYPFSAVDSPIQSGVAYLVAQNSQIFKNEETTPIVRNLVSLLPTRKITIGKWETGAEIDLYDPARISENSSLRIIHRDRVGKYSSLVLSQPSQTGRWIHHPDIGSDASYRNSQSPFFGHSLSPGKLVWAQESQESDHWNRIQLTEVLWSGSYRNGSSILADRFLEWKVEGEGKGSALLELEFPQNKHRNQTYLLPTSSGYDFISRGFLECFPHARGLVDNQFQLYNDRMVVRLRKISGTGQDSEISDVFELDPDRLGRNTTTHPRRRASAVKMDNGVTWTNSIAHRGECPLETAASPGTANHYLPEKEISSIGADYIVSEPWISHPPTEIQVVKTWFYEEISFLWDQRNEVPLLGKELVYFTNHLREEFGVWQTPGLVFRSFRPHVQSSSETEVHASDSSPSETHFTDQMRRTAWVEICNPTASPIPAENWVLETASRSSYLQWKSLSPLNSGSVPLSLKPSECLWVFPPGTTPGSEFGYPMFWLEPEDGRVIREEFQGNSPLDLFSFQEGVRIHLASYGNRYLGSMDTLRLAENEKAVLEANRWGGAKRYYKKERVE